MSNLETEEATLNKFKEMEIKKMKLTKRLKTKKTD